MAGKITDSLFTNNHFKISILILIIFFITTWHINVKVKKEMVERTNVMIEDIGVSNIHIATNMLDNYGERLSFLKATLSGAGTRNLLYETMLKMKESDSSINDIYIEPLNSLRKNKEDIQHEVFVKNKRYYLKFSLRIDSKSQLSMLVDLMGFHQKFSETDTKQVNAYITITKNGVYLYHPEEEKIGTGINKDDINNERRALLLNTHIIEKVNSDYLDMPVYRYYYPMDMNGEKWMFTANIPNLDLFESIQKTGNDFLMISLLATFAFLAVFSLGILRWRKEFIRRREIEQQNLNLQLRDEQYKQTVVAAELERLKSGLNPHFLFNSLSSLKVLVSKDSDLAKDFAITLSNLYRYLLKQENQNVVALKEELDFTKNYISLQKIRFANKIVTEISLADSLMNYKVPPISLQLLVENCIKHTKISDNEPLRINIFEENGLLVVTNNYNPRESEIKHSGMGIDNLIKRYSFLTQTNCHFGVVNGYYIAKIPLLLIS
jgi:sensor histidine kinase YesM